MDPGRQDLKTVREAVNTLKQSFGEAPPHLALILGSGLGEFAKELSDSKALPYSNIPGFPKTTIPGHVGECCVGRIENRRILIFRGRFHYYEGHSLETVVFPVRVAATWGIKNLIVTCASGAIRKGLTPGGLFLLKDHINLIGANPLRGPNIEEFGPRFVDMTTAYDEGFAELARTLSKKLRIPLPEGVYAAFPGPSYETPAEIQMLESVGADVVGMSTVPEVIAAKHHGMRVLGISVLTNYAAGIRGRASSQVSHEEVLEFTKLAEKDFRKFLKEWIATYED